VAVPDFSPSATRVLVPGTVAGYAPYRMLAIRGRHQRDDARNHRGLRLSLDGERR